MSKAIILIPLSSAFYVAIIINYIKMDIKTIPPAGVLSTDLAQILKCPQPLARISTWYPGPWNKNSVCYSFKTRGWYRIMTTNNCKWYMDDISSDIDSSNDKEFSLSHGRLSIQKETLRNWAPIIAPTFLLLLVLSLWDLRT